MAAPTCGFTDPTYLPTAISMALGQSSAPPPMPSTLIAATADPAPYDGRALAMVGVAIGESVPQPELPDLLEGSFTRVTTFPLQYGGGYKNQVGQIFPRGNR